VLLSASPAAAESGRPLVDAVKNQDKAAVGALLKKSVDVNAAEPAGPQGSIGRCTGKISTPPRSESRVTGEHALASVKLELELGIYVHATNKRGQTATAIADTIRAGSATISSRTCTGDLLRKLGAVENDLGS
jgi:hypothetical protein